MNRNAIWAITYLILLVVGAFFLPIPASRGDAVAKVPVKLASPLALELRGNDSKRPIFRENYRNRIHFLLTSKQDNTRVFQEWCSWGYFTRSFTAEIIGGPGKRTVITRNPNREWTKNYPAYHELDRGEFLVTDVDLCDGTWLAEPALPVKECEMRVTGHFKIKPDEETREHKVFTGMIYSRPITIVMGKDCMAKLNNKK